MVMQTRLWTTQLLCCVIACMTCLSGIHGEAHALEIFSDANDGFLEARGLNLADVPGTGGDPGATTLFQVHPDTNGGFMANVGEWFNGAEFGLTVSVIPFQLPNFGAVNDPFATADLGVMVYEIGSGPTTVNVDLYGVRVDSNPAIALSDWYIGSALDPNATAVPQSVFLYRR